MGRDRLQRMDVGDRTTPNLLAGHRIMIGGARWLGDEGREQSVAPGIGAEHVVVPVDRSEVGIHIPALADELHAGDVAFLMTVLQGPIESNGLAVDALDARDLKILGIVHADAQFGIRMELGCVSQDDTVPARLDLGGQDSIAGQRHALGRFGVRQHREGPQGHVVGEPDRGAVRRARVELEEVRMQVDLVRPACPLVVWNLVLIDDIHAVIHIPADHQRNLLRRILPNLFLLLVEDEDHAVRVHDGGCFGRRRLQRDR